MTIERIQKAIEVINYAIKHGTSVNDASVKSGYASTYVKNIKRDINEKYEAGLIDDDQYDLFYSAYEKYLSSQKLEKQNDNVVSDITESTESPEVTSMVVEGDVMDVEVKVDPRSEFAQMLNLLEEEGDSESVKERVREYNNEHFGNPEGYGYPNGHIKTLDQLLAKAEVDLDQWQVASYVVNKWDVTAFKEGYPQTWENYQVKARLERVKGGDKVANIKKVFQKLAETYQPPVYAMEGIPSLKADEFDENNLLEVSLFDLHIGKLGWAGEVGENYDTKIARQRFLDAIAMLIRRAKGFSYKKIIFPIGNDFFNSDNLFNTTTKGTQQDEDLRWQKTWDLGCQLIVDGVNMLKATGVPVEVLVIPGNHDQERSKYLGSFIDAWFRNDDQVSVNNSAKTRKYVEWGEVLLGFTHGNEEKENSLPLLMATEEKEMWGRTTFHEWHLGHFHKKRSVKFTVFDKAQMLNEDLGVTVRYLSSLSGLEEWHYKKGYIGTHKAGEAFVWNDKSGLIANLNFTITDFEREH
jgi:hypothetical protein